MTDQYFIQYECPDGRTGLVCDQHADGDAVVTNAPQMAACYAKALSELFPDTRYVVLHYLDGIMCCHYAALRNGVPDVLIPKPEVPRH